MFLSSGLFLWSDDADDAPSATEEEALVQDGDEDESREEAELGGLLEEEKEEEEYNPWPIAPDGKMMESDDIWGDKTKCRVSQGGVNISPVKGPNAYYAHWNSLHHLVFYFETCSLHSVWLH